MKCPGCGEVNEPGNKFCKTCGINLNQEYEFKEDSRDVKKVKVEHNYQTTSNKNKHTEKKDHDGWCWGCCICLFFIFIIFALVSH